MYTYLLSGFVSGLKFSSVQGKVAEGNMTWDINYLMVRIEIAWLPSYRSTHSLKSEHEENVQTFRDSNKYLSLFRVRFWAKMQFSAGKSCRGKHDLGVQLFDGAN